MAEPIARSAVFLDRDGTIIEDCGAIATPAEVDFFPFAFNALRRLQERHLLFIVTNQSCVGLGKVSLQAAAAVNDFVLARLKKEGIDIRELYCCSHKRDDNCPCIKPKPYFLHQAQKAYNIDLSASFTVGDHPHDVEFGRGVGATGLYLLTGHGTRHRADVAPQTECFNTLHEATQRIMDN